MSDTATVEQAADFGDDARATAARWISELELSIKDQASWSTASDKIIQRFRNELAAASKKRRYALLWSNVCTLGPAIYARTPQAVVSRRFKDADPVGRYASEVLERGLDFAVDAYDFDNVMTQARDSYLLLARGQAWVRYIPHMATVDRPAYPKAAGSDADHVADAGEKIPPEGLQISESAACSYVDAEGKDVDPDAVTVGDDGNATFPEEEVEYEEVRCDYVSWDNFGTNPARTWAEVRFVWRLVFMTRDELVARFGKEIGQKVPLDYAPKGVGSEKKDEQFKKAAVYEIWDLTSKKVFWINRGFNESPLDERDDPLGLTNFFPCPRPLMGTKAPDSFLPIADYLFYQDQADEIDELTQRIALLTKALRLVGLYSGKEMNTIQRMLEGEGNKMIAVDSWAALKDQGGLKGVIEWLPLDMVITTLQACYQARKQLIDDVYQITGVADILRGASDPNETATAQGIKAQWGSVRVRDRQREIERFSRDLLRIKGEIIAGKFGIPTLKAMTGVQLLTRAEKAQIQQQQLLQAQQAQLMAQQQAAAQAPPPGGPPGAPPAGPPGAPPGPAAGAAAAPPMGHNGGPPMGPQIPPDQLELMSLPAWEDVAELLQNKVLRTFRIEIETDSTVEPDEQEEKQRRVEFTTAIGQFLANSLPVVQAEPEILPIVMETLKFVVRGFRVGREMEDVIDKVADQLQAAAAGPKQPPQPNPLEVAKAQAEGTKAQAAVMQAQNDQQSNQIEAARVQSDHAIGMGQVQAENTRTQTDAAVAVHQTVQKAEEHRLTHEINLANPPQVNTP